MPTGVPRHSDKEFELPEDGSIQLMVLVDVIDLGLCPTQFGPKHKVRFRWFTQELDSEGHPYSLAQSYNKSFHENAKLTEAVLAILGVPQVPDELYDDLDVLIGRVNRALIEHNTVQKPNGQKTYANVTKIMSAKGATLSLPAGFIRKKDKDRVQQINRGPNSTMTRSNIPPAPELEEDEMPF